MRETRYFIARNEWAAKKILSRIYRQELNADQVLFKNRHKAAMTLRRNPDYFIFSTQFKV